MLSTLVVRGQTPCIKLNPVRWTILTRLKKCNVGIKFVMEDKLQQSIIVLCKIICTIAI